MRTTLALDDDVLEAARALARQQGSTLGAVISGLVLESKDSGPMRDPHQGCFSQQQKSPLVDDQRAFDC